MTKSKTSKCQSPETCFRNGWLAALARPNSGSCNPQGNCPEFRKGWLAG